MSAKADRHVGPDANQDAARPLEISAVTDARIAPRSFGTCRSESSCWRETSGYRSDENGKHPQEAQKDCQVKRIVTEAGESLSSGQVIVEFE